MEHWDFQALEAFDRTALEELGKFLARLITRPMPGRPN